MDFFGGVENARHDYKMHLSAQVMHLDSVHSIKSGNQSIGILHYKFVIVRQNPSQKFRLGFCLCLDHEAAYR